MVLVPGFQRLSQLAPRRVQSRPYRPDGHVERRRNLGAAQALDLGEQQRDALDVAEAAASRAPRRCAPAAPAGDATSVTRSRRSDDSTERNRPGTTAAGGAATAAAIPMSQGRHESRPS